MKVLTRDAILSADDLQSERVKVPEWGGEVIVRGMTGKERDQLETEVVSRDGKRVKVNAGNIRARLLVLSCIDEDGKRVFTDKDVKALGEKSGSALDRVAAVAQRLSKIRDSDIEAMGKD